MSVVTGTFLIRGGSIVTMDDAQPFAEALSVQDGVIAYVGTTDGAAQYVDAETEIVELHGGMCIPGFVDAHDHFATFAITKLGVNLSGVIGREAIAKAIAAYVASAPPTGLLRGYGWMPDSFAEGGPRREWLDEVTGDRPMVLFSADSHDMWFNTAAMRVAGISAATPDPDPGAQYFKRDADGTPNGWAIEGAQLLLSVPLGVFDIAGVRASQELTITPAPSWGITTYMDAGVIVGPSSADAELVYADLVARDHDGTLPLRIVGTVWTRNVGDDPAAIAAQLSDWNARLRSEHVSVSVCKMWSDGVMMSEGALLLEPFCNHPHSYGHMTIPYEQIVATIEAVQHAGFDMHIHVDGDGSVRTVLNALEEAQSSVALRSSEAVLPRHTIAHNSMVAPSDIPRYEALGVLANCTPLWGTDYNGQYLEIYEQLIGPERMEERLFPYGDLLRAGAVVTYGADIPGVDVNEIAPLLQLEAAVTRKRPGFPDDRPLVARQGVSVAQALRAYTLNGAIQLRMEDRIGSLEVGKRADLVVLAEDLFTVPVTEIHNVPVVLTMMDGKVTFRRDA